MCDHHSGNGRGNCAEKVAAKYEQKFVACGNSRGNVRDKLTAKVAVNLPTHGKLSRQTAIPVVVIFFILNPHLSKRTIYRSYYNF
jgi:hypothetical protein